VGSLEHEAHVVALDLLERRERLGRGGVVVAGQQRQVSLLQDVPEATTMPRSSTLRSSRTLPGQSCPVSCSIASAETPSTRRPSSVESCSSSDSTSSGMSSRRSRSGGS